MRGSDRGDSLVEILVAMAILGLGIAALTGAIGTTVMASGLNREQARGETHLLAVAEYVKSLPFVPCGPAAPTPITPSMLDEVEGFTASYGPAATFEGRPCSEIVSVPVTVMLTDGSGYTRTVLVLKRAP